MATAEPTMHGALAVTAVVMALGHTLAGPDHYLPFVAMARVGGWSLWRTLIVTALCGVGHVLSSVILGLGGIWLGTAVFKLETIEQSRGSLAAWMLLIAGLTYFVWGLNHAMRQKSHHHGDDGVSAPDHGHSHGALDAAALDQQRVRSMTFWTIFTIFAFGPCEPLIPFLMVPAAGVGNAWYVLMITLLFGATTIATMLAVVTIGYLGLGQIRLAIMERYGHAMAGFTLFACGAAMKFGL